MSAGFTAIIIPVHNRKHHTLPCVEQLSWCLGLSDWRVYVVDDGSTDGTAEALRAQFPPVQIITGDGSLYWTGGISKGMQAALNDGASEIVWLNDDTTVEEASLRRLVALVSEDRKRIVSATALLHGEVQSHHCKDWQPVIAPAGKLAEADVLAGFLVAFSSEVPQRLGLPDARRFPHYAGDGAYTHEAYKAGFKLWVDGGSFVHLRDFEGYASLETEFWRASGETLAQRVRRCFIATRSKHRLATLWHLDQVYRGVLLGMAYSLGRVGWWALLLLRAR